MENEVKKDLSAMVKSIGLRLEKNRYGSRSYAKVVFFNDKEIDFIDKENKLYDFLMACRDCGHTDVIKSKRLIEDVKNDNVDLLDADAVVDKDSGHYYAVEYVVKSKKGDRRFLLFLKRYIDSDIIDMFWDKYLELNKTKK